MFDDLTKVNVPFGLLDEATREALKAHGGPYEWWHGVGWFTSEQGPSWDRHFVYRVKSKPPKPREWWCLMDTARGKAIPYAWSTSREDAMGILGASSCEIIHVREVTDDAS